MTQLAILVSIFMMFSVISADGSQCNQVFNFDALYSIIALKKDSYYQYTLAKDQGAFTYALKETPTQLDADYAPLTLYYNFCNKVKFTTEACATEVNSDTSFALTMVPNTQTCATDITRLTSDSRFDNYQFEMIDSDSPQEGIVYRLNRTNTIDTTTTNLEISYIIYCDTNSSNIFTVEGWKRKVNTTNVMYFVQARSYYGCPTLQISKIWTILSNNNILFTILMITLGTLLCFFGLKIYKPTMFIIGYITGFAVIVVVVGEFVIRYDSESLMAYTCLMIAVFFGVLTGYITIKNPKVGFFALGMWLGVVLALLLNNAILYKIQIGNTTIVLWITIAILSFGMGVLSCFFYKYQVMVCTGFIGAYLLIRPFGWIIGSFPNELELAKQIKYGTLTTVPSLFYLYLALILIIGLIGIRFQWGMYSLRREAEEENDFEEFLADPEFIEENKDLLEKDDDDLTEKEKKIKQKVIRMQKNVEKEKRRQEKVMKRANLLKKKGKKTEGQDDDENDEEGEEGSNDQNSEDEDNNSVNETKKSQKGKKQETSGFGFGLLSGIFGKTEEKPKKKKKNQGSDSEEEDESHEVEEELLENDKKSKKKDQKMQQSKSQMKESVKSSTNKNKKRKDSEENEEEQPSTAQKKFSAMFSGIKKNKRKSSEEEPAQQAKKVEQIEMDDLSETHSATMVTDQHHDDDVQPETTKKREKSINQPSEQHKSKASHQNNQDSSGEQQQEDEEDEEIIDEEAQRKSKKKADKAKNIAQLAKSQKKQKKQ